ncbi:MAG TPA: NAD(P)-binding protein, partial [Streptosporangiaceae bacterium]|nr:NAD(P)-binding protein [Streptosporangiaceae bacterium]
MCGLEASNPGSDTSRCYPRARAGDECAPLTWFDNQMDADAIVVGAGLAGLVATAELARAGRRVLL